MSSGIHPIPPHLLSEHTLSRQSLPHSCAILKILGRLVGPCGQRLLSLGAEVGGAVQGWPTSPLTRTRAAYVLLAIMPNCPIALAECVGGDQAG